MRAFPDPTDRVTLRVIAEETLRFAGMVAAVCLFTLAACAWAPVLGG
ncbi:hypothetical protein [Mangrovibrevibacter kandeliae]|nr:hypothetical protein [Aurantimonas sp. CSK15Z-1]MCQ8781694.1 hypothetical protein [Aurantimonas sp. CSK15Z-1]